MVEKETLEITHADKGWFGVESEDGERWYVSEIWVAGNRIKNLGRCEIKVGEWQIEDNHYNPALLIESAPWYTPKDD